MQHPMSLDQALPHFQTFLHSRNTSSLTQQAYIADMQQFIVWLKETTVIELHAGAITKTDMHEYLAYLADLGRSGVTRARKLASIREFFRYLVEHDFIPSTPAASVAIPKKEHKQQTYLRPDEYAKLLSAASSHPPDFAMLQMLLQTGIRVSELVSLTLTRAFHNWESSSQR
jgi:site-specific recombinase XerD